MERKYIFTKDELEEFGSKLWTDGFYDGQICDKRVSAADEYSVRYKDIEDRIKELQGCTCHTDR